MKKVNLSIFITIEELIEFFSIFESSMKVYFMAKEISHVKLVDFRDYELQLGVTNWFLLSESERYGNSLKFNEFGAQNKDCIYVQFYELGEGSLKDTFFTGFVKKKGLIEKAINGLKKKSKNDLICTGFTGEKINVSHIY